MLSVQVFYLYINGHRLMAKQLLLFERKKAMAIHGQPYCNIVPIVSSHSHELQAALLRPVPEPCLGLLRHALVVALEALLQEDPGAAAAAEWG